MRQNEDQSFISEKIESKSERDLNFSPNIQFLPPRVQTVNSKLGMNRNGFESQCQSRESKSRNPNNLHPFNGPKLHLYKKGSRRIKTSSATRSLQPHIVPSGQIQHNIYNNIEQVNIINHVRDYPCYSMQNPYF